MHRKTPIHYDIKHKEQAVMKNRSARADLAPSGSRPKSCPAFVSYEKIREYSTLTIPVYKSINEKQSETSDRA
jgi:hypothetical protein